MKVKLAIIIVVFLLGLYFMCRPDVIEGFDNSTMKYRCPNVLIQKGTKFYLYNSKLANVPGVNPVTFNNLEDYTEFMDWQRSQGIRCPVLYLQESYDAQGNPVYNARPSPNNLQGGLPPVPPGGGYSQPITKLFDAGRDDPPYNVNSFPSYDQQDQYIGLNTPLDQMFHENWISCEPQSYGCQLGWSDLYAKVS